MYPITEWAGKHTLQTIVSTHNIVYMLCVGPVTSLLAAILVLRAKCTKMAANAIAKCSISRNVRIPSSI